MADWSERVSSVFGSLNATLKTVDNPLMKEDPNDDSSDADIHLKRSSQRKRTSSSRSTSRSRDRSKRRANDHPLCSRMDPDYIKNPHRWKKYDLIDDGTGTAGYKGLSDEQINSKAAFEFLSKLHQNQTISIEQEREKMLKSEDKLVFKKPLKINSQRVPKDQKMDNAFKIPVGKSESSISVQAKPQSVSKSKHVTLSHLEEEEED